MANFLGDPYQNIGAIEYKLSVPPSKVIEIVKEQTENFTSFQYFLLPFPIKNNVQFWSRFSSDYGFRIFRKSNARGYTNSFAPWLVGYILPDKKGCSVSISFEMDRRVSLFDHCFIYLLLFFSGITGLIFLSNIFSGKPINDIVFFAIFIAIFWVFSIGVRIIGLNSGQQDRVAMIEFLEGLFSDHKI